MCLLLRVLQKSQAYCNHPRSVDWTSTVHGVRIAGELCAYAPVAGDATNVLLTAWLQRHFAAEDVGRVQLYEFLRCETRGTFLRCSRYGNDDKRIDYCVQVRSVLLPAMPLGGPAAAAAAVVGAAAVTPEAPLPAAAAAPHEATTWHGNVEVFYCARLPPMLGRNATEVNELLAVVQPLAEVQHFFREDMELSFIPADEVAAWDELREWMQSGELLAHMVSVSRAQSQLLGKRIVRIHDIVAKRCLLESEERDEMLVVQLQNLVEEL